MYLASFLNNLIKEDGFVLINANSTKYIIGRPKKENPITIKLLDKKLHYKLLLYPDLYLGESYTDGSLVIENSNKLERAPPEASAVFNLARLKVAAVAICYSPNIKLCFNYLYQTAPATSENDTPLLTATKLS